MELLGRLNRDRHLTVAMVTHEPGMAAYASRTIHFRDGLVHSDSNNHNHSPVGITPIESTLAEAGRNA